MKPKLQGETIGWIAALEIPEQLRIRLLAKTKSIAIISHLGQIVKNIPSERLQVDYYKVFLYAVASSFREIV